MQGMRRALHLFDTHPVRALCLNESGPYPEKKISDGVLGTRRRGRVATGELYSCQKAPRSNHFEYFEVHVFH